VRLEKVDLTRAWGLRQAQLDLAQGDAGTRLPPGLARPASWTAGQEAVAEDAVAAVEAEGAGEVEGAAPAVERQENISTDDMELSANRGGR
jgi:hypothetical protein